MNRILFLCVVVMGVSFSGVLKAENVFYCQSELATGFAKDGEKRRIANFKLKRFTIKFNDDFSELRGVSSFGATFRCSAPYSAEPELLLCSIRDKPWELMSYHKRKKRFVVVSISSGGYVDEGSDSDNIYGGKCENF